MHMAFLVGVLCTDLALLLRAESKYSEGLGVRR